MKFQNSLIVSVRKAKHKRLFVLQEPLICIDDTGRTWTVPKGFTTDFASIPAIGRAFIPKAHPNAYAAVLHDFLYETQPLKRRETDQLFREALLSPDCNTNAATRWVMYKAVRSGGATAWRKAQNNLNSPPNTEAIKMADENTIEEDEKNAFFEWLKRWWNRADRELDELDDEVRTRANRLFRQANWPGVRDREALFRKKVKRSWGFKIAYALVFLSSCITLYYWWGAMPDITSKLLIGLGFFAANLLMPIWARMTFWQGGTWLQPAVNFAGLLILLSVSAASIVASAGLQGTKSDEMRSTRYQQKVQYETQMELADQRNKRLVELRTLTSRTPSEITAELDGLLVTEPSPQSECRSRDNFGSWSKRNCSTVSRLRVEISQAQERVRLEGQAKSQTFKNLAPVSSADPQYEMIKRHIDVTQKEFNNAKPLILAILLEMIFNGLTILLTITIGAEVREEIQEKIRSQRRALINQAEAEFDAIRPKPEPIIPAPVVQVVQPVNTLGAPAPLNVVLAPNQDPVAEVSQPVIIETTIAPQQGTLPLTAPPVASFEPEPEPEDKSILPKPLGEYFPNTVFNPATDKPLDLPEEDNIQEPELLTVEEEIEPEAAESERNEELLVEMLGLKLNSLVNDRSVPAGVRLTAEYALARVKRSLGARVALDSVWRDYAAWCSNTGNVAVDSVDDLYLLLVDGLGLTVLDTDGKLFVMDTNLS